MRRKGLGMHLCVLLLLLLLLCHWRFAGRRLLVPLAHAGATAGVTPTASSAYYVIALCCKST